MSRPLLKSLLLLCAAWGTLASCGGLGTYATPCYDDSGCENGLVCRSGECVLQCVADSECASTPGSICRFNRCIASDAPGGADAMSTADLGFVTVDAFSPVAPDAAVAVPDAAVVTPDAAVSVPDAAVVTPDSAVVVPDAAVVVPDAVVVTPDAAVPDAAP